MIPDRLQYFWEHFRNDQKYDQIWTLGPNIYHQNIQTNTRKYGNILEIMKVVEGRCIYISHVIIFDFFNFGILKFEKWELGTLKC